MFEIVLESVGCRRFSFRLYFQTAYTSIGGQAIMAYERLQRWGQHSFEYGTTTRKVLNVTKPRIAAGLAVVGVALWEN